MKQIKYYSKKNLESMVQTFNKKYGGKIKTKQNKLQLYNNLKKEMSGSIQVPKCIMRKLPNINKDDIFKVNGPTIKGEWLSTVDIDNIMTQYENIYENFMYLGTVPIDFKKIYPEIFNINMNKDNHNMYGLILNTDPSTKSGQHWIALFINQKEQTICFFDSNGISPPKQVIRFINHINKNKKYTIFINRHEHQKRDGSCGLYALNFIISRIKGYKCDKYFKCIKTDEYIEKSRTMLFK